jgi:hypothetical protein
VTRVEPELLGSATDSSIECFLTLDNALPADAKNVVAERVRAWTEEASRSESRVQFPENGTVGIATRLTASQMTEVCEQFMLIRRIRDPKMALKTTTVGGGPESFASA